jgi:hypothetical protein
MGRTAHFGPMVFEIDGAAVLKPVPGCDRVLEIEPAE